MEQETIEEANWKVLGTKIDTFYNGAKWQAERSFNNEEVIKIIQECKSYLSFGDEFDEIKWFEQFKKK